MPKRSERASGYFGLSWLFVHFEIAQTLGDNDNVTFDIQHVFIMSIFGSTNTEHAKNINRAHYNSMASISHEDCPYTARSRYRGHFSSNN